MKNEILYILVLYGVSKEESRAWQSLKALLSAGELEHNVYIHDNTAHNIYLAAAYNKGLAYAVANKFPYVVLLDDDASLTEQYMNAVKQATASGNQRMVWAPRLTNPRHQTLSPRHRWMMKIAFNSGLLLPVSILQEIGGFNTDYPLDYLDYWLCYQLHQRHIPILTLPATIMHDLSVNDYKRVSRERYQSLLLAEKRFAEETGKRLYYRLLLLGRLIKWSLTGHLYIKETKNALFAKL